MPPQHDSVWPIRLGRGIVAALRDRTAAVALLTAIVAPVLFLLLGFAVDYGYASYLNQRITRAADSSVLASVSQNAATTAGGYSDTTAMQSYGASIFTENVKPLSLASLTFNLTVTPTNNGGATAVGTYNYNVPTFFAKILGVSSIPIAGTVSASAKPITYVNYYVLVDASQSMGIGATATDMQNLYNRVVAYNNGSNGESGCVFGCHVKAPGQNYTNEQLAHNSAYGTPLTLRIDSAVTAIQDMISDAQAAVGSVANVKFGLYVIQANPSNNTYVQTIAAPSNNYSTLQTQAATIDLGPNTSAGLGDTDFPDELTTFNTMLPANGSGASATSPLNYVFLITDGVTDTYSSSCFDTHCTSVLDSTKCQPLQAKATVGVIYTTYLPVYANNNPSQGYEAAYSALVQNFAGNIAPALQACATSNSYYFEASDGPAIDTALRALFAATLPSTARLTQ